MVRLLMGSTALALSMLPAAVGAQEVDAALEEVVVTGSRIRGVQSTGSGVVALDREAIVTSGAPTTADLLKKVPQISGLGASEAFTSAQNGAANVTRGVGVNLRGLGSNATLLLWNGRRFPAAGTQGQFTDPAAIPTLALGNVEIVADGASAVYGSDAVAGVVNLMLRKGFQGSESFVRYGAASGYDDFSLGHVAGMAWSGGEAMIALEHNRHSALQGEDRDFFRSDLRPFGGSDFRGQMCLPGTIVAGGVAYPIPAGGVTPATAAALVPGAPNRCETFARQDILPEQERSSLVFTVSQDVGERVTLFAEGYYSNREFTLREDGLTAAVNVPNTNPFFASPVPGATSVTVNYDFGPSTGATTTPGYALSYALVAGARVKLWGDWAAEAYVSKGRSADSASYAMLDFGLLDALVSSSNPAVALNLFSGSPLPASRLTGLDDGQFIIKANTGLTVVSAQADGTLFELPGGAVRLAVGAEHREEKLAGVLYIGPKSQSFSVPSYAEREVTAVFAEAFVPLVGAANEMPGIRRLDLSLAGRYEEYSDFGETFNPKVGLSWEPVEDLTIRATYGRSFRAAGLSEVDPTSGGYGLYADTLPNAAGGTSYGIGIAGGNADLQPEEATTWSAGAVLTPAFAPGLRLEATYFSIDYENQILALRGTPGLLTSPFYAQYVTLNPTPQQVAALLSSGLPQNAPIDAAQVTFIADGRRQNLGVTLVRGIDFNASYRWSNSWGEFEAGVNGEYFTQYETAPAAGAPSVDVLARINFPQRFRARASLNWSRGPVQATTYVNFTDSYIQNTASPHRKVEDYATVDLNLGFDLGEMAESPWLDGATLSLNAQNLFDADPPFVNLPGGYDSQSVNPIGRLVSVSLRKRW